MQLTKKQLQEIYENNTAKEAQRILGIAPRTLRTLLKENDIPLKGQGNRVKEGRKKIQIIED
jgi:hypothetical protein